LPVRSVLLVRRVLGAPPVHKAILVRKASLAQWVRRVLWVLLVHKVNPVRRALPVRQVRQGQWGRRESKGSRGCRGCRMGVGWRRVRLWFGMGRRG
jgi:hypothetical protein